MRGIIHVYNHASIAHHYHLEWGCLPRHQPRLGCRRWGGDVTGGIIVHTGDGGKNWNRQETPNGFIENLWGVAFPNNTRMDGPSVIAAQSCLPSMAAIPGTGRNPRRTNGYIESRFPTSNTAGPSVIAAQSCLPSMAAIPGSIRTLTLNSPFLGLPFPTSAMAGPSVPAAQFWRSCCQAPPAYTTRRVITNTPRLNRHISHLFSNLPCMQN